MPDQQMTGSDKKPQNKAAVIGWPIKHSRSPMIHGHWLKTLGINGSYEKIAVSPEELPAFISNLKTAGFAGINITIPHKEAVLKLANRATEEATAIGAANTLWFEGADLVAGNTDGYGFLTHLKTAAPDWRSEKPALILGAGGAARAILYALLGAGVPQIHLTNRTRPRAEALAADFGPRIIVRDWESRAHNLEEVYLTVNTSSLGMAGNPPLEFDLATLPKGAVCYDIVYTPLETEFLKAARARGLTGVDGLGMLLHQAVPGFEKWFGQRPAVTAELTSHIIADLEKD